MKTKLDLLREFYSGKWYPLIVAALVVIGNGAGIEVPLFAVLVATFFVGCLIAYDFRFALTPFLCTVFFVSPKNAPNITVFREHFSKPSVLISLVISFGLLAAGILIFVIRNRRRRNSMPWKGFFLSMAIWCVALALNGLLNPAYTVQNFVYALNFPLVLLLIYLLFALYVRFDAGAFDYFMYTLMLAGVVIAAEIVLRYLFGNVIVDGAIVKENVVLGWAVWTTAGGMLAFAMPACFYFAATHRNGWAFYILGLLEFFCVLLSQSRGALLVGAVVLLISIVVLCVWGPNRKDNRWITLILGLIGMIGIALLWDKVIAVLQNFLERGFNDNGRFALWEAGWTKFCEHPILGAGFYDNGIVSDWDIQIYPFFYHNTVIQMLGSVGVVGLLAYLWHRFTTVRRVFRKPTLYKTYLGLCLLACIGFCMLDVMFFITYPLIFYTLILLFMEQSDAPRT
ncbi:MAG: O-antigen ligase family protein [Clostridia bacterium]|nr:O-antigen ligase family protein [Clostridia bacterium]MBQ9806713.1 O-antigen ligase family protein [Clostridia bacterium]